MNIDFEILAIISVLTALSTECIKKIMQKASLNYISNIIASIMSVLIAVVLVVIRPMVVEGVPFSAQLVYNGIVMAFFGVLSANLTFDKIWQTIQQLKS